MKKKMELKKETVSTLNAVRGGIVETAYAGCNTFECSALCHQSNNCITKKNCTVVPDSNACVTIGGATCLGGQGCIVSAQCDSSVKIC